MSILLETTFGDLVIDLDVEGSPALCKNVLKLTKARYYTNTLVYNVVPGKYCQMGGERLFFVCRTRVPPARSSFSFSPHVGYGRSGAMCTMTRTDTDPPRPVLPQPHPASPRAVCSF